MDEEEKNYLAHHAFLEEFYQTKQVNPGVNWGWGIDSTPKHSEMTTFVSLRVFYLQKLSAFFFFFVDRRTRFRFQPAKAALKWV